MSGGFSAEVGICNDNEVGSVVASTLGTSVTPGTGAYGAWVQLTASSPSDTVAILAQGSFRAFITFGCIWRIGVGGAGSEVVIADGLHLSPFEGSGAGDAWGNSIFPLCIPAGTRIAVAAKSNASDITYCKFNLFDGSYMSGDVAGYDAMTVASLAPSASANTKGSWAQLTASTARDYIGILMGQNNISCSASVNYMMDVGIGGAGSEVVILDNFLFRGNLSQVSSLYIPIEIPAGTRVAARCQAASASSASIDNLYICGAYK